MAHVAQVTTEPLRLELKSALRWGKGSRLDRLEHVLVKVETDTGQIGVAEAPARPTIYGETTASIEAIVRDYLAPKLVGLELTNTSDVRKALHSVAGNLTAKGALDIALCEARAQSEGKTLFEVWRGSQERVRVSYILGLGEVEDLLTEARHVFEQGVSVFKVKIGRDRAHDKKVIEALSAAFTEEDVILYADANEGLEPETAAQDLARLAELGIAYVEEPLPVELLKERAALKAENILPIIADDSCFTLRDLSRELAFDTFNILNIKTARTGFTTSAEMLRLARSEGKGVMVGSQASSGLGTYHAALFASQAGVTHPSELSFPLKLQEDRTTSLRYERGYLSVAQLAELRLNGPFTALSADEAS